MAQIAPAVRPGRASLPTPFHVCAVLLGVLAAGVGLGLLLHFAVPEPYARSVLDETRRVLRLYSENDSWFAMSRALEGWQADPGAALYGQTFFAEGIKFQYPPTALFLSLWLGPAQADAVPAVYVVSLVIALAVLWLASARVLEVRLPAAGIAAPGPFGRLVVYGLVAALALTFYPVVKAFVLGQIQLWLDALFALALLVWIGGRKVAAGVLVGLACLVKPQLALFLPWALLRREWSFALALSVVGAVGLGASMLQFGFANHLGYLEVLRFLSERGESFHANQSFNGLLNRIVGLSDPAGYNNLVWSPDSFPPAHALVRFGTLLTSFAILVPALLLREAASTGRVLDFCTLALSATLASPIAWEHHYGILFPIFAALLPLCRGRPAALAWLAAGYLLSSQYVALTDALAPTAFNFVQSYLLAAGLLVLALIYYLRLSPGPGFSPGRRSRGPGA